MICRSSPISADGCEEKGLIRILQRQHLPQDVGVPTGGAAGDVVAGIGDEDGTLLLGHRHLQRLVRFGGQAVGFEHVRQHVHFAFQIDEAELVERVKLLVKRGLHLLDGLGDARGDVRALSGADLRFQRGARRVGGRIDAADPAGAGPAALLAVENAVVDHRDGRDVARLALADGMHSITLLLFI